MTNFNTRHLHPYQGIIELPKILQFVGECNVLANYCAGLHSGDICHFLSNALRGRDLEKHFHVYEDANGQILGTVLLYPAYCCIQRATAHTTCSFTLTIEAVNWKQRSSSGVNNKHVHCYKLQTVTRTGLAAM